MRENSLHVDMKLCSKVELANLVHSASDEICRLAGLDEDAMLNLGLALREALINAMKHGNKLAGDKPVDVTFDLAGDRLVVTIRDRGEGFDYRRHVDPRLPENINKTNGRGLFLMRNFVDEVAFARAPGGGTVVRLVKKMPRRGGRRGDRG